MRMVIALFVSAVSKAVEKGLIKEERLWLDSCLVKGGFTNWQKAKEKFKEHEKTKLHRGALQKLSALKTTPIKALSSDAAAKARIQRDMSWK